LDIEKILADTLAEETARELLREVCPEYTEELFQTLRKFSNNPWDIQSLYRMTQELPKENKFE
jgi:hypothetical protein